MMSIPKISLEQWASFKAVVDEGSFAAAAEALNKSQSTVSYSLGKMEERLPAPLFEQQGRKAELTEFGRTMYRHASSLLQQALEVDHIAQYLVSGGASELSIVVDAIASMDKIFCALHAFSEEHPVTRIKIYETTLSGTDEMLLQNNVQLAITARVPPGFLSMDYGVVTKIPVAAPDHPLVKKAAAISEHELKQYRQIVIRDSGVKREQSAGWLQAERRWTVSHFSTSISAIKSGLGFGFVPKEKIEKELTSGELVQFEMEHGGVQTIPLYVVVPNRAAICKATQAALNHLLGKDVSSSLR